MIGNRAAAYAPVPDLGLVALWDDGDDLLAEPRAPYPHTRDVLALRAAGGRRGGAAGRLRPDRGDADLAGPRLADRARRGPAGGPAHRAAGQGHRRLRPGPGARPERPGGPAAARGVRDHAGRAAPGAGAGPGTAGRLPAGAGLLRVAGSRCAAGSARARPGSTRRARRCRCAPGAAAARSTGPARSASPGRSGPRWWAPSGRRRSWAGRSRRPRCGPRSAGGRWPASRTPRASWSPRPGRSRRPRAGTPARCCWTPTTLLLRPDLRAAEEALRRWLNVGGAGPQRRGRRLGDRRGGERRPGAAGPGPDRPGRLRRPRAGRAGRGGLPARGADGPGGGSGGGAGGVRDLARLPPGTDVLGPVEVGGGVADRRAGAAAHAAGPADGRGRRWSGRSRR